MGEYTSVFRGAYVSPKEAKIPGDKSRGFRGIKPAEAPKDPPHRDRLPPSHYTHTPDACMWGSWEPGNSPEPDFL